MAQAKKKFLFEPAIESGERKQRRGRIRFKADANTLAYTRPEKNIVGEVDSFVALVVDESHAGCKLAFLDHAPLDEGDFVSVKVGELPVLRAEVRWRKAAGVSLCEIGLRYLDV